MNFDFKPEEFIVEEITLDGTLLELSKQINLGKAEDQVLERDYFTHFVLEKRNWNTMQALQAISRLLHVKPKRFDFAGTKDRNALTTQLCSAFCIPPQRITSARLKDMAVNGAWKSREKMRLGDLAGNRFTITLTEENCGLDANARAIEEKLAANNFLYPNFFGAQRFGSLRKNTAIVGRFLIQGDFAGAVENYLTDSSGEKDEVAVQARARLAKEKNYAQALEYFPQYLKYERMLLEHLAACPNDYAGALSRFPRHLQLMFVHAFQSQLFNDYLTTRLEKGVNYVEENDFFVQADALGFPTDEVKKTGVDESRESVEEKVREKKAFACGQLIGSQSVLREDELKLLEKHGVRQEQFVFKTMPWLSSRGNFRPLFAPVKNFAAVGEKPCVIRFELASGCYATALLEFILSNEATQQSTPQVY